MGGAMSMPGSGPSVEDVVALAKGNSVPYAIPLPMNEVCLMSIMYIRNVASHRSRFVLSILYLCLRERNNDINTTRYHSNRKTRKYTST